MTYRYKTVFVTFIFLIAITLVGHAQDNTDEYGKTIEMADNYFSRGDYINAKASYQIAVRLAPSEQYAKDRLQQSLDMIKVQMYQNTLYTQKIQIADNFYDKQDMEAALKTYEEALKLLPGDVHATERIRKITGNQIDSKLLDENYQNCIVNGDLFLKGLQLENALAEYRKASALKPAEAIPKEKAMLVEKLIAESKAATSDYEKALQEADLAISHNKYDEAISLLESAIRLKPDESQPKAKLAETQKLKIAWDSYSSIINEADNLYISKDFEKAKEKYLLAQSIKPADEYPKRMLEKIDIALMDISKANRSSYEVVIALADKLFNQQDYEQAMIEYKNALRFKPEEEYAKQRISDINNALSLRNTTEEAYLQAISRADNLYREERFEEARDEYNEAIGIKPLEQYPKVKVDEINTTLSKLASQREVYNNLIKGADRLFFSDEYVESREQYRNASYLFPREKYPLDQITMINEILGIRDKYVKAVTKADQLLYDKDYEGAMLEFRNAAGISPAETYPQEKIKEIETLVAANAKLQADLENKKRDEIAKEEEIIEKQAYQEALDTYQQEKVFELEAKAAELKAIEDLENQYRDAISAADIALQAKDYQKAAAGYQAARGLKPGESYPQEKIDEINATLGEIAAKEAVDKQYRDAISAADIALQAKDYQKALTGYQSAMEIKPAEQYAKGKVLEIETTMAEQARQLEIENQYVKIIANADAYFKNGKFEEARTAYQEALTIKPAEDFPNQQIIEINRTLENQVAQREQAYQIVISKADNYFTQQDYEMAKLQYDRALELKPDELYPKDKLKLVNEQILMKRQLIQAEYDKTLVEADRSYTSKTYDDAINSYRSAALLKPDEDYPKEMVSRILKLLTERSIVQINKDPLLITNNTQYKFDFMPVPVKDRKSNYIFFRARNVSKSDYKLIISYGKDQTKNGGVVIKVPAGEELYEYVVRISAQYKWFSDDNNWISFYPEGGDFEVYLMQISYSD